LLTDSADKLLTCFWGAEVTTGSLEELSACEEELFSKAELISSEEELSSISEETISDGTEGLGISEDTGVSEQDCEPVL